MPTYYTYRNEVPLKPGEKLGFTRGRGYYAIPAAPARPAPTERIGGVSVAQAATIAGGNETSGAPKLQPASTTKLHPVQPVPATGSQPKPRVIAQPVSGPHPARGRSLPAGQPGRSTPVTRAEPSAVLTELAHRHGGVVAETARAHPTGALAQVRRGVVLQPTRALSTLQRKPTVVERRVSEAYHFFRSKGLTPAQAAGVVGNLQYESGGRLNPAEKQIGGGPGRGIAQWTVASSRWNGLLELATREHVSASTFKVQLEYVWHELRTTYSSALTALRETNTVADATTAFESRYEAAGVPALSERITFADEVYSRFNG
jgi:hypothetical protein